MLSIVITKNLLIILEKSTSKKKTTLFQHSNTMRRINASKDTLLTGRVRVNLRVNLRNLKMTLLTGTLSHILLTVVPKLKMFCFSS